MKRKPPQAAVQKAVRVKHSARRYIGSKCPRRAGGSEEKHKTQDGYVVHLSPNIGITRIPLSRCFVPRRPYIRIRRYSSDCHIGTRHSLRFQLASLPLTCRLQRMKRAQPPQRCAVKAMGKSDCEEFLTFCRKYLQAGANRCVSVRC